MEHSDRVVLMLKAAAQSLGRPLDVVETRWATAIFVAVVMDGELSRQEQETPS